MMQARDPYRLADVYLPPDLDEYIDYNDEQEWSGAEDDWEVLQKGMTAQAQRRFRQYLAMNGAATWSRIDRAIAAARLQREAHPEASIVAAVTAGELLIRFFLVRPMIAGLVFNTRLAMRLVRDRQSTPTARDRQLLPEVCRAWSVDIEALKLANDQPLWLTLLDLIEVRNRYVHRADPVLAEQATGALDCVEALLGQLVKPLSQRAGLDWPPYPWTHKGRTHDPVEAAFEYMGS